jgi:hypothetical protein
MATAPKKTVADEELRRDPSLPVIQDLPFEPPLGRHVIEAAVKKVLKARLERDRLKARAAGAGRE